MCFSLNFPQGIFFFFLIGRAAEAGPGTSQSSLAQVVLLNKKAQSSCKQSVKVYTRCPVLERLIETSGLEGKHFMPCLPLSRMRAGEFLGSSRLPKTQEQQQKNPRPITMLGFFLTAHIPSYFLLEAHPPPTLFSSFLIPPAGR